MKASTEITSPYRRLIAEKNAEVVFKTCLKGPPLAAINTQLRISWGRASPASKSYQMRFLLIELSILQYFYYSDL